MRPISDCCTQDSDCESSRLQPCQTKRCVAQVCTTLVEPLCCTDDSSCQDGLSHSTDTCQNDTNRCAHCEPACPEQAGTVFFQAHFDNASTLAQQGFQVIDSNLNDDVQWRFDPDQAAAGAGSIRLGRTRCLSYYNGALDPNCQPTSPTQADSSRVSVTLMTPFIQLPDSTLSLAQVMVRSLVEPHLPETARHADLLRVKVLAANSSIAWPLTDTGALGKVFSEWRPLLLDLAPWRGQPVRLVFEFDSLDGRENAHPGVWLDELKVSVACGLGGCCTQDSDCSAANACEQARCLALPQGSGSRCVSLPSDSCASCDSDSSCDDGDACTTDSCENGVCQNTRFCCLERTINAFNHDSDFTTPWTNTILGTPGSGWYAQNGILRFGHRTEGTYEAGAGRAHGTLTSPLVLLPQERGRHLQLRFQLHLETEWPGGAPLNNPEGLDRLTVELVENNLTLPLWTSDSIGGSTQGLNLPVSLSLDAWRGRDVRLRLRFDSADGNRNQFSGPSIHNLEVVETCAP